MIILTQKISINTPKIIPFDYKLIHPHPNSILLSNYFFFTIYLNIFKILVSKVSIKTNIKLIKVCLFANLFCVYAYFIFNVF